MVRATGLDLHFLLWQKIKDRLRPAVGGNAHPRCNGSVQALPYLNQKKKHPFGGAFPFGTGDRT